MWAILNDLEFGLVLWLNSFAGISGDFDHFAWQLANNSLVKGGVMVGLLWGAWSLHRPDRDTTADMVRTLFGVIVAIFIGRALQLFLPHRDRPLHEPALDFQPLEGMPRSTLDGWSAFPSDNGVLYVAIAVALLFRVRWLGVIALAWAAVVILLPRVYSGAHYPSDVVCGGILGAAVMFVVMAVPLRDQYVSALNGWRSRHPAKFQALAFMISFEAGTQFGGSRFFAGYLGSFIGLL